MLESVAKTKWCPYSPVGRAYCCLGSDCMMFQVTVEGYEQTQYGGVDKRETEGYCGLARRV